MIIHQIHDLSNLSTVKILEQGMSQVTDTRLIKNYHPDYKNENSNLFYILQHNRFKIGNYYVIEEDNNYICSSGWNWYENDIALALTRTYVIPECRQRNLIANNILPRIIKDSKSYNRLWITCNEHNKAIFNAFVRIQQGKATGLNNTWDKIYGNFLPIGIRTVNFTDQYVAEYKRTQS
jgi:hypothetical protein